MIAGNRRKTNLLWDTVCTQSHKRLIVIYDWYMYVYRPVDRKSPYTVSQPAAWMSLFFAHVHYLSHLHSCAVCIFSLFIGNHFYIYIYIYIYSICIVKADSSLVVYRFILFYFALYICIHVAPWSSLARHLVPLYVHRCSGITIKIGRMSVYVKIGTYTWLEDTLTWYFGSRVLHNCVLLNVFMQFSYKI